MARSLWKPICISRLGVSTHLQYWKKFTKLTTKLCSLRETIHFIYFFKNTTFFFRKRSRKRRLKRLLDRNVSFWPIQFGMKLGMLCPFSNAGGYRAVVDAKKKKMR